MCVLTVSAAFMEPPFKCTNEGWGEFEMSIDLFTTEKGGKQTILHDLNFAAAQYENVHTMTFKNPSQALQQILRETGPLPSDEERKIKKADGGKKKKTFDVEKMADGLIKLGEDDLLQVIQLIHDHKDDSTYIQNNIDAGEFSVDLYTLPDSLLKMLWDLLVCFFCLVRLFLIYRGLTVSCKTSSSSRASSSPEQPGPYISAFNGVWRLGWWAKVAEKHWLVGWSRHLIPRCRSAVPPMVFAPLGPARSVGGLWVGWCRLQFLPGIMMGWDIAELHRLVGCMGKGRFSPFLLFLDMVDGGLFFKLAGLSMHRRGWF
jgi:hypothetical protein